MLTMLPVAYHGTEEDVALIRDGYGYNDPAARLSTRLGLYLVENTSDPSWNKHPINRSMPKGGLRDTEGGSRGGQKEGVGNEL